MTVANANPALSNPVFTYNPYTGSASAQINFSDPGWPDTHTAVFDWAGSTDPGAPSLIEHTPPDATGRFSSSHEFGPGCITAAITVTVTDDDGGSATYTFAPAGTLARYSAVWQAPVKDGMRNVVKQGNVIPLKIRVTDCLGNSVVGKTLTVSVTEGVVYAEDITDGTVILPTESVGSHTDGIMRYVDSHYMYNLATKQLKVRPAVHDRDPRAGHESAGDDGGDRAQEVTQHSRSIPDGGPYGPPFGIRALGSASWKASRSARGASSSGAPGRSHGSRSSRSTRRSEARSGSGWRPRASVTPTCMSSTASGSGRPTL